MNLMELIQAAQFRAEDWGEYRIVIEMDGYGRCEDVTAIFNEEEGTLTLTEHE